MAWRVLVVEDEPATSQLIVTILRQDGYEVRAVEDGREALDEAERFRPHLALLDSGLPGLDGPSVAARLKERQDVAVMFVSGADSPEHRKRALRLGADDYVGKPFDPEELSLRVRRTLERSGHRVPRTWRVADLEVDEAAHRVTRAGVELSLTVKELGLLYVLGRHVGQPVPKRQVFAEVWGYEEEGSNVVESHMSSLRRKLEALGPPLIHTRRGLGYVLGG